MHILFRFQIAFLLQSFVWIASILPFARIVWVVSLIQEPFFKDFVGYIFMATMEVNPSKKISTPMIVWGVSDIQQRMLGGCFEGYIVSRYGSYNVASSGYKYIHCDLIDLGCFFHCDINYWVILCHNLFPSSECWLFCAHHQFQNNFPKQVSKRGLGFIIKVGISIIIENIDVYPLVWFVPTHIKQEFMRKENLENLGTIWVVIRIHGRSAKSFIIVVLDGLGVDDTQALSFFLEFHAQYDTCGDLQYMVTCHIFDEKCWECNIWWTTITHKFFICLCHSYASND